MATVKQLVQERAAIRGTLFGVGGASINNAKPLKSGVRNEEFDDLMWMHMLGAHTDRVDNKVIIDYIVTDEIATNVMRRMVNAGYEFANFPYWIELSDEQLLTAVPEYLPRNLKQGEPRLWEDWHDANNPPTVIAGVTYASSHAWGSYLLGSELVGLLQDGYVLKTRPEIRALIAENATDDPIPN